VRIILSSTSKHTALGEDCGTGKGHGSLFMAGARPQGPRGPTHLWTGARVSRGQWWIPLGLFFQAFPLGCSFGPQRRGSPDPGVVSAQWALGALVEIAGGLARGKLLAPGGGPFGRNVRPNLVFVGTKG